jgi:hypothetical protein
MSLDYPNRADWLAVRRTPRNFFVGTTIWGRGTFAAGRNKQKRKAREEWQFNRRNELAKYAFGFRASRPSKHALSSKRTLMLSDRRLRQCGQA